MNALSFGSMASDMSKWLEHSLALNSHAPNLLDALQSVKRCLDTESNATDILVKGGKLDITIAVRGQQVASESPIRPEAIRLNLFLDANITGLMGKVVKKFPDLSGIGKVN